MALVTYALTTRQKVKDLLGITDTSSDTIIDSLINYVSGFIQSYCGGRNFLRQSYTEVYDTRKRSQKVFLNQRPVTAVTRVNYRSGTPVTPVWVEYDANGYLTYLAEGYIHFYGLLPEIHQGLQILYTAGYLIDFASETDPLLHTLPMDLTMAATELVAQEYNLRQARGIKSLQTEGQSITYASRADGLDGSIKAVLDSYKTPHFAV